MRKISSRELSEILEKHEQWLQDSSKGERAILKATDLSDFDLVGVNLQYANLQDAYLRSADLRGANLSFSNLWCAYLEDANLQEVNMRGSNLRYAKLSYADLRGADLENVNLRGASLYGVCRPWFSYVGAIGSRYAETLYFADIDSVKCGCWHGGIGGTLAEFRKRVDEVYPSYSENKLCRQYRLEYLSAIKMFESMREAYLKSLREDGRL